MAILGWAVWKTYIQKNGLGQTGGREAVGTFARLVARYGLKNVPTHVEIIAELPARRASAVTNPEHFWKDPPACDSSSMGKQVHNPTDQLAKSHVPRWRSRNRDRTQPEA
jgi:hypothetical protein